MDTPQDLHNLEQAFVRALRALEGRGPGTARPKIPPDAVPSSGPRLSDATDPGVDDRSVPPEER